MAGRKRGEVGGALARGCDRFEAWRRSRQLGARIPEKLWSLAVGLAETHGLSRTASVLKLDYNALKKRVAGRNAHPGADDSGLVSPGFIELSPSSLVPSSLVPSSLALSSLAPSSLAPSSLTPSSLTPSSLTPSSLTPSSLTPSSLVPSRECVVEFEDGLGARMRVHLRGCESPDLVALCRSFRSVD